MVVLPRSLVAPPWSNEQSMVISSLMKEHFNVLSFFLWSVHDMFQKLKVCILNKFEANTLCAFLNAKTLFGIYVNCVLWSMVACQFQYKMQQNMNNIMYGIIFEIVIFSENSCPKTCFFQKHATLCMTYMGGGGRGIHIFSCAFQLLSYRLKR